MKANVVLLKAMKAKVIFLIFISMIVLIGCTNDSVNDPISSEPNYTGQYQSVPYNSEESDPTVVLLLAQDGNSINGTGTWNGIAFSFSGTIISNHVLLKFDLTETNFGDLQGGIDTYVGNDKSLAGGYNLFNQNCVFSGAIRFRPVSL